MSGFVSVTDGRTNLYYQRERSRRCRRRRGRDGREIVELVVKEERCVSEERKEGEGVTDEPVAHDEGLPDSVRTAYERHRLTLALSSLRALSTRCSGRQASRKNELSQTAVARAFDLLPSDLQVDDSQRDATVSLQIMSEASGVEGGAEQSEVRATSTERVLRSRTRVKKDVNFIPEAKI
ncbi:hypothetical protein GQ600_4501 [Phytophthora cactorum]|nr:hypothetical protein GQ600_4501 [Phytophthora cactorum]